MVKINTDHIQKEVIYPIKCKSIKEINTILFNISKKKINITGLKKAMEELNYTPHFVKKK